MTTVHTVKSKVIISQNLVAFSEYINFNHQHDFFSLRFCHVKNIPVLGDVSKVFAMNWRFLPMLDPQVSHMVSRDLDSLINEREAAAVQEWLASDKGK